jgi:hypothetical protein
VPLISKTFIGLDRLPHPTSNRPPVHCRPTIEHAILETSMNKNTNVRLLHGFGNLPTPRVPS